MELKNKYQLIKGDCIELLKEIETESIDAVVTDPPYQYLNKKYKNCHFDKSYNEQKYIEEIKRILKPTGFIVMFGRGVSFYRQGVLLDKEGFKFKEEVVWNKRKNSMFCLPLGRRHENCFIFAKTKKGIIRKCHIPFVEYVDSFSIEETVIKIKDTIRRLNEGIKKPEIFKDIMLYIDKKIERYCRTPSEGLNVTNTKHLKRSYNAIHSLKTITNGAVENDIMNIPDIIEEYHNKNLHHPTEKPVRLMERLIALVTDEDSIVLDSFMESGSTGVACMNTNRRFIGMELDEAYFAVALQRIEQADKLQDEKLI